MQKEQSVIEVVRERAMVVGNRMPSTRDVRDIAPELAVLARRLQKIHRQVPEIDFSPNVKNMLKAVASAKIIGRPNIKPAF